MTNFVQKFYEKCYSYAKALSSSHFDSVIIPLVNVTTDSRQSRAQSRRDLLITARVNDTGGEVEKQCLLRIFFYANVKFV